MPQDRASVVTTTILAIVSDAFLAWFRGEPVTWRDVRTRIENVLRDEFDDVAKEVIKQMRITD